jgi:hypothetical protein
LRYLYPFIRHIILNYAQGVYPKMAETQRSSYLYGVLNCFRELMDRDADSR